MITVGICDDEKVQRTMLRRIVEQTLELDGLSGRILEFADGEGLLNLFSRERYACDVIFLDIELGGANGVDTARSLRRLNREAVLIFVTGYEDYVFHGYEVGALNYILKPYREEKIREVVREALDRLEKRRDTFISVQSGTTIRKVNVKEILYLYSELRKIIIVLEDGSHIEIYGKLGEMKERLPGYFVRTHQRYLVNLTRTDRLDPGGVWIENTKLPVSRSRYQEAAATFSRLLLEG